jgi:hypothetical protein
MKKSEESRITVGDLKRMLNSYPDDRDLSFGGLEFYRLKDRGGYVQVEFSETVYRDDQGRMVVENHK